MTTVMDQLPRLSMYDPGVTGEGGLDPLGFASVADRIADRIAPGMRARMNNPRFVTLSAVGAIVCQALHGRVGPDGTTTPDLVFEWILVEAVVRHTAPELRIGLPGSGKAATARAQHGRLSPGTYLRGPRVFGFTGVYRPFTLDSHVLQRDGLVGPAGEAIVADWAADQGLKGFGLSASGSGASLAHELTDIVAKSLQQEESTLPPTGAVAKAVAAHLAPRGARARERRNLRTLVLTRGSAGKADHEIRDEIAAALARMTTRGLSERALASRLIQTTSGATRLTLRAAYRFEECVTAIDHAFRMMLGQATAQRNSFLDPVRARTIQPLVDIGPRLGRLYDAAVASASAVDDLLCRDVAECLQRFARDLPPAAFLESLFARHEEVQAAKGKLMWVDEIAGGHAIRPPFQNQSIEIDPEFWTHPMRLHTLATFLRETA
jgi:hypothetical protein